jgi:hypothetical protein
MACATSAAFGQARVLIAPAPVPLQADDQAAQPPANEPAPASREDAAPPARAQAPLPNPAGTSAPQDQTPLKETDAEPQAPSRFSFQRVDGGVLRLDRTAGEVAFCRANGTGWVCEAVPEDRAALEKEIEQLRGELAAFKKQIVALREPTPPPLPPETVPPTTAPDKSGDAKIKLPTGEDIARARAFISDTWHRLVEMIENWQKDVLRKT